MTASRRPPHRQNMIQITSRNDIIADLCLVRNPLLQAFQRSNPHCDRHEGSSPRLAAKFQQKDAALLKMYCSQDKLAADVRVETERRLKALETELTQAEHANKERAMAARYHKVKFFGRSTSASIASSFSQKITPERQKVIRKITQTEKQLSSETSDVSKRKLKETLHELRIDLNYILVRFSRLQIEFADDL